MLTHVLAEDVDFGVNHPVENASARLVVHRCPDVEPCVCDVLNGIESQNLTIGCPNQGNVHC